MCCLWLYYGLCCLMLKLYFLCYLWGLLLCFSYKSIHLSNNLYNSFHNQYTNTLHSPPKPENQKYKNFYNPQIQLFFYYPSSCRFFASKRNGRLLEMLRLPCWVNSHIDRYLLRSLWWCSWIISWWIRLIMGKYGISDGLRLSSWRFTWCILGSISGYHRRLSHRGIR